MYTSRERLVGSGHAKLTVAPYTVTRVHYTERVARLNREHCRGGSAEVAHNGRLGLSVSGIVPALLYLTRLFVSPGPPSPVVPWASSPQNQPSL